jgi:Taurine catabolism dioxygenase TauD, TfdA family
MNVDVRRADPAEMLEMAERYPRSVVVAQFDRPLTHEEFAGHVRDWSTPETDPAAAMIRVIRNEPTIKDSTALSLEALTPHTDASFLALPPSRFVLSCTRSDPQGAGASSLIPVDAVLANAPGWVVDALTVADFMFLKTYDGNLQDSHVGPALWTSGNGSADVRVRWRADHIYRPQVVDARGTLADKAAEWMQDFCQSCRPATYLLGTGEVMFVPNHYVIHGRQALSPASDRELFRAWLF